ncbi:MAG TPA: hypothetical protein VGR54_05580 [Nitrosopumilaceae archaeon]|nr:hypothetical protein [Nitrosopumilaceae archaeon]
MAELVQCTRCRNIMPDEDYDEHRCEPRRRNFKLIKFTSFHVIDGFDGRKILDINALNGDNFMFEEVPENKEFTKMPYEPNMRRDLTGRKNDKDLTESNPETLNTCTLKYGIGR